MGIKILLKLLTFLPSLLVLCEDFELIILHTNDVHSHIEQFNKYGGTCSEDVNKCFGGVARRHTVIENIRRNTQNVLLLDAGDQFSGSMWFIEYKGIAALRFMNYTKYDAMTIGNHEFDNGPEGLVTFLREANFSVVSSNIDVSAEPKWPKPNTLLKKSAVIHRSGRKIGVIGYTTTKTKWLSRPGDKIQFTDEIEAIKREVKILKAQGIDILIALGHSGFEKDQQIAKEIKDIDIVVGGHTNTFLYNGIQPSNDVIEGPYPTVISRDDGSKCLVVQDFTFGKYLGNLKVKFDDNGVLTSWSGNPIVLNASYAEDAEVLEMVEEMKGPIIQARNETVGRSLVYLQGSPTICRVQECNLGNLLTDAIVKSLQKNPDSMKWTSVALGFWNGGGIRSGDIDKKRNDWLTMEDLTSILPFANTADLIDIKGKYLLEAFENGVSAVEQREGRFPQVSGFRIKYDISKPVGNRLVEVLALCIECRVPEYKKIENEQIYKVATSSYLISGGDNYSSLKNYESKNPGQDALLYLREYFEEESPVAPILEGRIANVSKVDPKCDSNTAVGLLRNTLFLILSILVTMCLVF